MSILRVNIPTGQGGMKKASAVMIAQLRAIDKRRLVKKLGDLPFTFVGQVQANVKVVLDL